MGNKDICIYFVVFWWECTKYNFCEINWEKIEVEEINVDKKWKLFKEKINVWKCVDIIS